MSATAPVLITGASGFLAAWIIARLRQAGAAVLACDLQPDDRRLRLVHDDDGAGTLTWEALDITDAAALGSLFERHAPRAVIHLAALQIPACRANPALGAMVNVVGHVNVLEAARRHGLGQLIYTSSIAARPRGPANAPANLYGVYKHTDEEVARLYFEDHGLASMGLRPYVVYGVGRDQGETSTVTQAMRAAALGEPYELAFSARNGFQFGADVADMFVRLLDARIDGAQVSDLSDHVEHTDQVIDAIRAVVPEADIRPSARQRVSPESGFDTGPLRACIGTLPCTPLGEGARQTIERFRALHARGVRTGAA